MIKAKKLREGPGMKGKMQPARAINAKSNPRIIKKIIKVVLLIGLLNPDCAVGIVARRRKPLRNAQLERFWPAGIFINMLRTKIVKQVL